MKHDFIDKYSNLNSIIHHLDPRIKLLISFSFLILITLTVNLKLLFLYGLLVIVSIVISRVPFRFYLKKMMLITPLVLVFTFFIFLSYMLKYRIEFSIESITRDYRIWNTLALTAARIYLSILVITLLVSCTRFNDLLWSFRRFHFPQVVAILSKLVYTYIFVFIDEMHRTMRAYRSRTPIRRVPRTKVYGHIAAGILLRSMDRSDYIYKAMLSRGFNGEFPEGNTNRLKWQDFGAVVFFLIIVGTARILWNI